MRAWFAAFLAIPVALAAKPFDDAPRSRTFRITCSGTVSGLTPGQSARIWLPVPPSNEDQDAKIALQKLPAHPQRNREKEYGNEMLYFEAKAGPDGTIPFQVAYRIVRREVRNHDAPPDGAAAMDGRLLKPNNLVPVSGKPLELLKDQKLSDDPMQRARALYDIVNQHMRYSKEGVGWGRGDAVWACDSRYGNCSDFHSLFLSLARSQQIPATFEIGFPLPPARGKGEIAGYHCWAKFHVEGKGWVPVDISEANKNPALRNYYFGNLTEDRVAFSTGRDLDLAPKQNGPPLNFFSYPYGEVDGKPLAQEKVKTQMTYEDMK